MRYDKLWTLVNYKQKVEESKHLVDSMLTLFGESLEDQLGVEEEATKMVPEATDIVDH